MITGIDIDETMDVTLESDDSDKKTVFVIRTLTERERMGLLERYMKAQGLGDEIDRLKESEERSKAISIQSDVREMLEDVCEVAVSEVRDVNIGNKPKTVTGADVRKVLEVIDMAALSEVASVIVRNNFLSGDDEKN